MNLAIVDLESTSLKADQGFILCGGVKPLGGRGEVIGLDDVGFGRDRYTIDRKLVAALRDEMCQYDGWITWNGLLFDLPLLDDRLMICGEKPMERRFARGLDMMWHARKGKSTLTSSRLDWVMKALKCPTAKTDLDINTWKEAEAEAIRHFKDGRAAFDYIMDHCAADLVGTEFVFGKLKNRIQTISKR